MYLLRQRYHIWLLLNGRESTYWQCWRADLNLSTHYILYISKIYVSLILQREFLYCSVLCVFVSSALQLVLAELITMLVLSKSSKCHKTTRIFFNWKCIGGKRPSILNKPIVQWGTTLLFTSEQPSQCSCIGDNSSEGEFVVCWQILFYSTGDGVGKSISKELMR